MSKRPPIDELFEKLFRGVSEPYVAFAPDAPTFTILAVNDAFERTVGYSRDELEGRAFFDVFAVRADSASRANPAVNHLDELQQSVIRVSQEGGSEVVDAFRCDLPELLSSSGEGGERWWSSTNTAIEVDGEVAYILHRIEEITEAVESQKVIAERSRQQFYDLFMNAPALIALLEGPDHVYTLNNPAHSKLLGRRKLIGRSVREVFDDGVSHDAVAHLDAVYETGESFSAEETLVRLTDPQTGAVSERYVTLSYLPTHDLSGAIDGVAVFGWDVTELVEARKTVEKQAHQLRKESQLKDEFLAMLGHELRNPLAPLATVGQILSVHDGELGAERIQWAASIIDRQVGQLTGLVDDLLDVARISEGRIELERGRHELDEILKAAIESVDPLIERNRQVLAESCPDGKVVVDVDKTRLIQVLSNLLHNATKYTPEGGKIRLEAVAEGEDVLFIVEDTGEGIDAEMLPYVFDLFRQSDTSLARTQGGLGLGLTLVRRLVEMHGGSVCALSDGPGKGSRFEVRLPVVCTIETPRSRAPSPHKST